MLLADGAMLTTLMRWLGARWVICPASALRCLLAALERSRYQGQLARSTTLKKKNRFVSAGRFVLGRGGCIAANLVLATVQRPRIAWAVTDEVPRSADALAIYLNSGGGCFFGQQVRGVWARRFPPTRSPQPWSGCIWWPAVAYATTMGMAVQRDCDTTGRPTLAAGY